MTLAEICKVHKGRAFRRPSLPDRTYQWDNNFLHFNEEDILAEDWEIIHEEMGYLEAVALIAANTNLSMRRRRWSPISARRIVVEDCDNWIFYNGKHAHDSVLELLAKDWIVE